MSPIPAARSAAGMWCSRQTGAQADPFLGITVRAVIPRMPIWGAKRRQEGGSRQTAAPAGRSLGPSCSVTGAARQGHAAGAFPGPPPFSWPGHPRKAKGPSDISATLPVLQIPGAPAAPRRHLACRRRAKRETPGAQPAPDRPRSARWGTQEQPTPPAIYLPRWPTWQIVGDGGADAYPPNRMPLGHLALGAADAPKGMVAQNGLARRGHGEHRSPAGI